MPPAPRLGAGCEDLGPREQGADGVEVGDVFERLLGEDMADEPRGPGDVDGGLPRRLRELPGVHGAAEPLRGTACVGRAGQGGEGVGFGPAVCRGRVPVRRGEGLRVRGGLLRKLRGGGRPDGRGDPFRPPGHEAARPALLGPHGHDPRAQDGRQVVCVVLLGHKGVPVGLAGQPCHADFRHAQFPRVVVVRAVVWRRR